MYQLKPRSYLSLVATATPYLLADLLAHYDLPPELKKATLRLLLSCLSEFVSLLFARHM